MKLLLIPFALLLAATPAAAQITSAPGVCFAFNSNPAAATSTLPLVAGGDLHLAFTAPMAVTIERIDIAISSPVGPQITVQVFQWTGTAIGPLVGSGASLLPFNGFSPLILSPPVPLAAGTTYVLRLTIAQSFAHIAGDPTQPTPIPYLLNCSPLPAPFFPPCSSYPTSGTHGTLLRFRSSACTLVPTAVATSVGSGCGGAPSVGPPFLYTFTPPVLGTQFTFYVGGVFGPAGAIHLFWAAGPATAGLNLGLGGGCTSYLDPVSLQNLMIAGLEPLVIFPGTVFTNQTTVNIPANPGLAGVTVTTQALAFGTNGVITPFGNIQITNALQLALGF